MVVPGYSAHVNLKSLPQENQFNIGLLFAQGCSNGYSERLHGHLFNPCSLCYLSNPKMINSCIAREFLLAHRAKVLTNSVFGSHLESTCENSSICKCHLDGIKRRKKRATQISIWENGARSVMGHILSAGPSRKLSRVGTL